MASLTVSERSGSLAPRRLASSSPVSEGATSGGGEDAGIRSCTSPGLAGNVDEMELEGGTRMQVH